MNVAMFGVLAIAALFFLVTMGIAVGPLLLCRLLAGPESNACRPQPRRSSLAWSVLTFSCVVIGLGIGLFLLYFITRRSVDRSVATVVHSVTGNTADPRFALDFGPGEPHSPRPVGPPHVADRPAGYVAPLPFEVAEHSLFAPSQVLPSTRVTSHSAQFKLFWVVVMPMMLMVVVCGAVASGRFRIEHVRAIPLLLAVGLLTGLFFWTSARTMAPQTADSGGINTFPPVLEAPVPALPSSPYLPAVAVEMVQGVMTIVPSPAPEELTAAENSTNVASNPAAPKTEESSQHEASHVLTYVGTSVAGVPRQSLPEWAGQSDAEGPIRVIDSGLHATVQLAEEHALEQLKTLLHAELIARYPQAAGWQPPDRLVLKADNILQRAVETSQIQVGEFTEPMYETFWQVDLSRIEPLYQAWRPSVVQQRLLWIAGGLGVLTLLLGSTAAVLRVDEQTNGRRRKSLTAGTLTLWALLAGIAFAFVA